MRNKILVSLALVGMASALGAQTNVNPVNTTPLNVGAEIPVGVTPQHYNLNYVTGELTKVTNTQAQQVGVNALSAVSYDNSCTTGFFTSVTPGTEFVDWGDKAGMLSDVVTSFDLGYATFEVDPSAGGAGASLEVSFYSGTAGSAILGTEMARFVFSGLPGAATAGGIGAFVLTVDLTGGGEFCLPNGDIGYSYCSFDAAGTGPLLIDIASCPNVQDDLFDIFTCPAPTGSYVGTFFFGTPGIASFYMAISEDDGTEMATTALNNGSGLNSVLTTDGGVPPVLGATWPAMVDNSAGHSMSLLLLSLGSLPAGSVITAGGELIADPMLSFITSLIAGTGMVDHSMVVPKDVTLLGLDLTAQGANFGGLPFVLGNALDIHIGF